MLMYYVRSWKVQPDNQEKGRKPPRKIQDKPSPGAPWFVVVDVKLRSSQQMINVGLLSYLVLVLKFYGWGEGGMGDVTYTTQTQFS